MRIAVIGSGISGLGSAYLLNENAEVYLFECDNRLGGHSHTVEAEFKGTRVPVDTGFIVFNPLNYPNLVSLFERLSVPWIDTDMSFGMPGMFFVASPNACAAACLALGESGRDAAYFPWFWRYIMLIIRHIPERIFKRMNI